MPLFGKDHDRSANKFIPPSGTHVNQDLGSRDYEDRLSSDVARTSLSNNDPMLNNPNTSSYSHTGPDQGLLGRKPVNDDPRIKDRFVMDPADTKAGSNVMTTTGVAGNPETKLSSVSSVSPERSRFEERFDEPARGSTHQFDDRNASVATSTGGRGMFSSDTPQYVPTHQQHDVHHSSVREHRQDRHTSGDHANMPGHDSGAALRNVPPHIPPQSSHFDRGVHDAQDANLSTAGGWPLRDQPIGARHSQEVEPIPNQHLLKTDTIRSQAQREAVEGAGTAAPGLDSGSMMTNIGHTGIGAPGSRVVHKCVACGVDNDISRYFLKDAVYRLG